MAVQNPAVSKIAALDLHPKCAGQDRTGSRRDVPESMKTMKALSAALILLAARAAIPQDADLQKVLSQMDASSTKFQDVQADIAVDNYTAVVQDHEMQKGITAFRRVGGSMEMASHLDSGQTSQKDLLYKNGELDVYSPQPQAQEMIFSAGANRAEFDSLLATGFGASGKDLAAAWTVTFQGIDQEVKTIDGTLTAKLDLVSKQESIRKNFSHLTIWVDLNRDISVKQIMVQPDGDSRTVTYTNIRYNKHPPASLFILQIPKGTRVQRH
jgi:outer membrane lipoprotein-sorting protein